MGAAGHIFISYSRNDAAAVDAIADALSRAHFQVWIDRRSILGATLWRKQIVEAIWQASAVILMLSPDSAKSINVRREIDVYDDRVQSSREEGRLIPVRLKAIEIPADLRYNLAGAQTLDWFGFADFDAGIQELLRVLKMQGVESGEPGSGAIITATEKTPVWRAALITFGATAVIASAAVVAVSKLAAEATGVPSSLTALMPVSLAGASGFALWSAVLATALAGLAAAFMRWKNLRPSISGISLALTATVIAAAMSGQHLAAAVAVVASLAICASWLRKSQGIVTRRALVTGAAVFLGSVLLGGVAQQAVGHRAAPASIIGVTSFEVLDEKLRSKQMESSNLLQRKLSSVFAKAGLSVMPRLFDSHTIEDWNFESWSLHKAGLIAPRLVLRTTLNGCRKLQPQPADAASYIWVATLYRYSGDLAPLFISVSEHGADAQIFALRVAFKLLSSAPLSNELNDLQELGPRKVIVDEIRNVALARQMTEVSGKAEALLHQPSIKDEDISDLLEQFHVDPTACDEAAASNRAAYSTRANAYDVPAASPPAVREQL